MTTSVEKVDRFLEVLLPALKQKLSDELGVVGHAAVEALAPALEEALTESIDEIDPDDLDDAIAAVTRAVGGLRSDDAEPLIVAPSDTPPIPLEALEEGRDEPDLQLLEGERTDLTEQEAEQVWSPPTDDNPDVGTCPACREVAHDPWCPNVGDGRPVDRTGPPHSDLGGTR